MKTRIALYCYYLSISLLTVCAIGIVVKLLFWPPCTQTGNTCVIEPWSVAGLAGTVLAVAATVLAVLGAVAVAAWWASLNDRVTDQVKGLYQGHKKEIGKELEDFIAEQQQVVSDQVGTVQTKLQTVEDRIGSATADIDELEKMTHDFLDIAIDGIVLALPGSLETWAQKATSLHKFPRVPFKMAERYLTVVEPSLTTAEQEVMHNKDELDVTFKLFKELCGYDVAQPGSSQRRVGYIRDDCRAWLDKDARGETQLADTLNCWEGVLRWRSIAESEKADAESLRWLDDKIGAHQFKIDQLKLGRDQLKEQQQLLIDLAERQLKLLEAAQDTSNTASQS